MSYFLFTIFGVLAGVLGGMGMGGGTFLIPLLTIFLNINQKVAQGYNLLSFILMGGIALAIHMKNKLVEKNVILPVLLPAIIFSAVGAMLANYVSSQILRILFGAFLILLSFFEFYKIFKDKN